MDGRFFSGSLELFGAWTAASPLQMGKINSESSGLSSTTRISIAVGIASP
jgi:hypothetical protein